MADFPIRILVAFGAISAGPTTLSEVTLINSYAASPELIICSFVYYVTLSYMVVLWLSKLVSWFSNLHARFKIAIVVLILLVALLFLFPSEAQAADLDSVTIKKDGFIKSIFKDAARGCVNLVNDRSFGAYTISQAQVAVSNQLRLSDLENLRQYAQFVELLNQTPQNTQAYWELNGRITELGKTMARFNITANNIQTILLQMEAKDITAGRDLAGDFFQGIHESLQQAAKKKLGLDNPGTVAGLEQPGTPSGSSHNPF